MTSSQEDVPSTPRGKVGWLKIQLLVAKAYLKNMKSSEQIAKHLRDIHFGGNWTAVNIRDTLDDLTWQQANTSVYSLHPIATLVFHMNYYVSATIKVLRGGSLDAHDKFSFDCPLISSQEDWDRLLDKTWADAEELASLIEQIPDSQLSETFVDEKYGTYFRCLQGPIEHCHYHLGQIAIIKTILRHEHERPTSDPLH